MFKRISPIVALTILSGCSSLKSAEYHQETLNAIQKSNSEITNHISNLQLQISNQNDYIDSLENKVLTLSDEVKELANLATVQPEIQAELEEVPEPTAELVVPTTTERPEAKQKMVLGALEYVTINVLNLTSEARVDTGTATSSLNAMDISEFERNGKKWVRFHLSDKDNKPDETNWIESPIVRYARIRQSNNSGTERRVVVQLWVKIGNISEKTEFTLADRTQMSHPILLGREFIRDIAVVDVSRKFIHAKAH